MAPPPISPRLPDPQPVPALTPGERLGDYAVLRFLGGGGMGQVYEAEGPAGRRVALKVLELSKGFDEVQARQRLEREGEALGRLDHPNVVRLIEQGVDEATGRLFLAVEYVDGQDLDVLLARCPHGRLTAGETMYVIDRCARALEAAHAAGISHRDIKPGNVLVDARGLVKLSDFGLALASDVSVRLTARDRTVGTLEYMAPEVLHGEDHGPEADLYSLGVLAYALLTGQPPFTDENPSDVIYSHLAKAPPSVASAAPATPGGLVKLVGHLLNKDPGARPTAPVLLQALAAMSPPSQEQVAEEWSAGRYGAGAFAGDQVTPPAPPKPAAPPQPEATFRVPPRARLVRPKGRLIRPRRKRPGA